MTQDDTATSHTVETVLPATSSVFPGATTAAGARSLYLILLGRQADSPARVAELAIETLDETLRGMIGSPEFTENLDSLSQTGALPARGRVPSNELEKAATWLEKRLGTFTSRATASWAGLLYDTLAISGVASMIPADLDRDGAMAALKALLDLESSFDDRIAAAVAFDPAYFVDTPAGRTYSDGKGQLDPAMPVPKRAPLPGVLALFTEGMEHLDGRDRPATLAALIRDSQKAARNGLLRHWLFDQNFYEQAVRESADVELDDAAEALDPYIQFLVVGDPADISPHPLFCPYAYRKLNADVTAGPDGCFRDYVSRGARQELRTSALFDPEFYLSRQPHVRQEIASGRCTSALEHFVRKGLQAGYAFSPDFDRHHYLGAYPDVAEALSGGHIPSAEWHYVTSGAAEGRQPNRFFNSRYYTERYPSVGKEMRRYGIHSSIEHFLLLGRARGWRVNTPPVERDVDIDQAKALFEKRGRRAYAEALSGVFSYEESPTKPGLSVIVPISGQADFTAGFLKCARWAADHLQHKRGVTTEIIIVDNGSKDHTEQLLAALPGVRVVRFEKPIGFPAAVNAGAAVAGGDVLLIANNDIEFQADAFLRVIDGMSNTPGIGVLGAKIILPNETLQEVGSVLDKDAGAYGFGRGLDATECHGSRLVDVDYASGCFIAVTQEDFASLSGLNEAYSPGYYEEVDLSLRMRRILGKATLVDTGLAITHYEHASFAKGRPQTVNEPLILRNRARLKATHAELFISLRDQDPTQKIHLAQQALSGPARILVVEDMMPSGLLGSGFGREEEILDIFAENGIAYDIVALNPSPAADEYKNPLVRVYRAWMPGQSLDEVLVQNGAKYSHLWLCRTHNLTRANGAIREAKIRHGLKVICDTEALAAMRIVEHLRVQGRDPQPTDLLALATAELHDPIGVDLWVAVNNRERELMESLGVGPVCTIGHSVSLKTAVDTSVSFQDRKRMLFIGAVHELTSPNYDGLIWFLTRVWPKLNPADRPVLTVAGHWAPDLAEVFKARFAGLDIEFVGSVTPGELARLYAESRVAIAPTRYAGGIPCKVIESVLAGVPIVMTDLLAEQLDVLGDPKMAFASRFDDGVQFAGWIETLCGDADAWAQQRARQAETIGVRSSPLNLTHQVESTLALVNILP